MMTIAFALLAAACILLWHGRPWSWTLVIAALALGVVIFFGDVDLSSNLGVQL
jgi:hypothetical protein